VKYAELAQTPCVATVRANGTKLKVDGPCSIVEMDNSYLYGHELHSTVHWPGMGAWDRIEIAIPYEAGVQLLKHAVDGLRKPMKVHDFLVSI
jgi:hypothetical protein